VRVPTAVGQKMLGYRPRAVAFDSWVTRNLTFERDTLKCNSTLYLYLILQSFIVVLYRNVYSIAHRDRATHICLWEKNDLQLKIKIPHRSKLCPLTLLIVTANAGQTTNCICCKLSSGASIATPTTLVATDAERTLR
jgi:hypothetical protein